MFRPFRSMSEDGAHARTIPVGGVDLHWMELGSGPPLVLLHGLGESHHTWSRIAPRLAREYRVLMPDLGGHGRSARPNASYSLAWHARVIGTWTDALGLDRFDLVGHSFGGGVAQWMLLDHAPRIRKLALVAAGGLGREVTLALRLAAFPHLIERLGQPFMLPGSFAAFGSMRNAYSPGEVWQLARWNASRGSARAFARTVRDVIDLRGQSRGFFERAHEIATLPDIELFWGEDDRVIPLSHGLLAASQIDGATLHRFPDCGHYPHRERPNRFLALLRAFLGDPAS